MRLEVGIRHAPLGSKAVSKSAALLACHVERAEPMLAKRATRSLRNQEPSTLEDLFPLMSVAGADI